MEDQVKRGIELGLIEMCFTEHLDCDPGDYNERQYRLGDSRSGFMDSAYYDCQIDLCRKKYGDRISLKQGVELGEPQRFPDVAVDLLRNTSYDLVIGSVHQLYGFDLSLPWPDLSVNETTAYRDYFTQVYDLVKKSDFDILAHLDVVKRCGCDVYGTFDAYSYRDIIDEILRLLISKGRGLEINSSGLRQSSAAPYPCATVIKWFKELGGEFISLGSDSHRPAHLAYGLDEARNIALSAGFKAFATFNRRKVAMVDF